MAVPLALVCLGEHLVLPGIPRELVRELPGSHVHLGALALGITPVLLGYALVEVAALLIPGWSRLRNGNPEGRAKLDLVARMLALVLASMQAFGIASSLESTLCLTGAGEGGLGLSVPLVVVSLVGGVCVQFVAARYISHHGLANGFVVLLGAGQLQRMVEEARSLAAQASLTVPLASSALAATCLAFLVVGVATWIVLGRPSEPPVGSAAAEASAAGAGAPYRSARLLAVRPWIPLPASSLAACLAAASMVMLPRALEAAHVPVASAAASVLATRAFVPILIVVTGVVTAVFARLLHRPGEIGDLAVRLGHSSRGETKGQASAALRAALLPSFLFLVVVVLAGRASLVDVLLAPLVVAVAIDLAQAIRVQRVKLDLVAVWEERRASAVPVLRAALAADGIASTTRGMAVLSLLQVFAPYAPAEILVKKEDEQRATRTLLHLLLGENRPEGAGPSSDTSPLVGASRAPWAPARRTMALAGCAAFAWLALGLVR